MLFSMHSNGIHLFFMVPTQGLCQIKTNITLQTVMLAFVVLWTKIYNRNLADAADSPVDSNGLLTTKPGTWQRVFVIFVEEPEAMFFQQDTWLIVPLDESEATPCTPSAPFVFVPSNSHSEMLPERRLMSTWVPDKQGPRTANWMTAMRPSQLKRFLQHQMKRDTCSHFCHVRASTWQSLPFNSLGPLCLNNNVISRWEWCQKTQAVCVCVCVFLT